MLDKDVIFSVALADENCHVAQLRAFADIRRLPRPVNTIRLRSTAEEGWAARMQRDGRGDWALKSERNGFAASITLDKRIDVRTKFAPSWRDTVRPVGRTDLIAIANRSQPKCVRAGSRAWVAGNGSSEGATRPKNEEAYDLYLHSVSVCARMIRSPTRNAIAMLERAVGLDPSLRARMGRAGSSLPLRLRLRQRRRRGLSAGAGRVLQSFVLDPDYIDPREKSCLARWNEES